MPAPTIRPPIVQGRTATATVPGSSTSFSQQAEDPNEKAQQEQARRELEDKFDNIKEHIKDDDVFAAWEENRGNNLWTRGDGTPYDHKKEVQSAQNGLQKIILSIKGLLGRPRLLSSEVGPLQDLLGRVSRALDRTEGYLPRAGQDTADGLMPPDPSLFDLSPFSEVHHGRPDT